MRSRASDLRLEIHRRARGAGRAAHRYGAATTLALALAISSPAVAATCAYPLSGELSGALSRAENKTAIGDAFEHAVRAEAELRWQVFEQARASGGEPVRLGCTTEEPAPRLGAPTAKVQIVEFSDVTCGPCRETEPTIQRIARELGDAVSVEEKEFPIGDLSSEAVHAAEILRCAARDGRYWEMRRRLLAAREGLDDDSLVAMAVDAGCNGDRARRCLLKHEEREAILHEAEQGALAGVIAVPFVFVDGTLVRGRSEEVLWSAVCAALLKAGSLPSACAGRDLSPKKPGLQQAGPP